MQDSSPTNPVTPKSDCAKIPDQGEITEFEPLGILSTKTGQYYNYLIRPAEAVMEREQPRSRWNKDKIGGNIADKNAFPNSYV